MTDNETRIAIAEACGWEWKYFRQMGDGGSYGWVKDGCFPQNADPSPFPDYPNDLNAMHEAEEILTRLANKGEEYILHLWEVTGLQKTRGFLLPLEIKEVRLLASKIFELFIMATARQRAEAFLRTLGKWKDT